MSDFEVYYLPADPWHVPAPDRLDAGLAFLAERMPRARFELAVHTRPDIIWPSENWEGVACPACEEELDDDWWWEAAEQAVARGSEAVMVAAPCCGAVVSLLDLTWLGEPASLARCVLTVSNPPGWDELPGYDPDLSFVEHGRFWRETMAAYGAALGSIWRCPARSTTKYS